MCKIHEKEFTLEDFSHEHLLGDEVDGWKHPGQSTYGMMWDIVDKLNECREIYLKTKDKKFWRQMIQLLPNSYNQTCNVMMNYEVLANIYKFCKNNELDEWREFCEWIESLPYSELITGAADSLETKHIFGEPFPWTKEADERLKAETEGIIKAAFDKELHEAIIPDSNKSLFSMKDLEEAMKHFDPNNGVKTHVTMMKED